jgi:peroxiredoxin
MASGKMPLAGEVAPEFELPDSTQTQHRLSVLVSRGRLVLLFYRGAW